MQQARLLLRRAATGQDLRGAAESAPKRFVEGDTSKMPAMRLAVDSQPPLRRPAKRVIIPAELPDQDRFGALPTQHRCQIRGRCPANVRSFDLYLRQSGTVGQHTVDVPLKGPSDGRTAQLMKNMLGE
jgi:hypothetical protein